MANPEDEEDEDSPAGDEMNNLQSVAGQVRLFFYKFHLFDFINNNFIQ